MVDCKYFQELSNTEKCTDKQFVVTSAIFGVSFRRLALFCVTAYTYTHTHTLHTKENSARTTKSHAYLIVCVRACLCVSLLFIYFLLNSKQQPAVQL